MPQRNSRSSPKGSARKRSAPSSHRRPASGGTRGGPTRSPRRLGALFLLLTLGFAAIGARLVMVQIVKAPAYAKLASDQRRRVVLFPARRGTIFDRDGEPLAISVDLQSIYADPALVDDPAGAARALAPVLDRDAAELEELLRGTPSWSRFEYLARQVQPEVAERVEELELPGIFMRAEPRRYYPNGRVAAQILGFAGIDGEGLAGIELQYDDILRGRPGRMTLEQDPSGRTLPQAEFTYERATPGRSLFLTIDKDIQYFTEEVLEDAARTYHAEAASAIVMDPSTGDILAIASVPGFDPNRPGESPEEGQRARALTDQYEPGSAYKIVTASAALEEGVVKPRTRFVVPDTLPYSDRVFHDSHSHATEEMTFTEIIEQSSNVGTIQIGLKLGAKRLDEYVRRFGFGELTGVDFPGESDGDVLPLEEWSGSTIATIPIGQGIAVTALQMASAYSTLANHGVRVEPKLLYSTMDPGGDLEPASPAARKRIVSRRTARTMTDILTGVVKRGTGLEARIPGYEVAGKTGTAQKALPTGGYGNSYVSSFAGYAPAKRPAVVTIVVMDDPSPIWGGSTAAPTFRAIEEFALRQLGVPPTDNAEKEAAELEEGGSGLPPAHD